MKILAFEHFPNISEYLIISSLITPIMLQFRELVVAFKLNTKDRRFSFSKIYLLIKLQNNVFTYYLLITTDRFKFD